MNDSISHKTEINKEYMIYLLDNFKEGIIERKNQARQKKSSIKPILGSRVGNLLKSSNQSLDVIR